MPEQSIYQLTAIGTLNSESWLQDCLTLFKQQSVNIRRLVMVRDADAFASIRLEILFNLPEGTHASNALDTAFQLALQQKLAEQRWTHQSLIQTNAHSVLMPVYATPLVSAGDMPVKKS